MRGSRGFSLLEIMIALIVVAIGIGVFLNVTSSNERDISAKATGNNYSSITNEILNKYVNELNPSLTDYNIIAQQTTANVYLNQDELMGIDLSKITVEITARRSDATNF